MYGALKSHTPEAPSNSRYDAPGAVTRTSTMDEDEQIFAAAGSADPIVDPSSRRQPKAEAGDRCGTTRPFHSVKLYVVCQGLIQLSYLILGSYLKSVITSIEKRFGLDSKTAGFMSSGFEIGNLIVILPVSYFGRRIHRPRAIAVGVWFMIAGGVLLAVPHWIYGPYQPSGGGGGGTPSVANYSDDLCQMNGTTHGPSAFDDKFTLRDGYGAGTSQSGIWRLMFFARVLVGIGAAPVQPYGISYMDDHASRAMAPLYLGVLLAISMVGPSLGYILGSATTQFYVDFDQFPSSSLTPTDADWIGAWWLGFLLASGVMFLLHIPFWFFPKSMDKEKEPGSSKKTRPSNAAGGKLEKLEKRDGRGEGGGKKDSRTLSSSSLPSNDGGCGNSDNDNGDKSSPAGGDTKTLLETGSSNFVFYLVDFFSASLRLLSNPVFLLVILAYATLFAITAGFAIFLPKYFQVQFGVSASSANLYIGSVQMPFGIVGVVLGGVLMRRWNLSVTKATAMSIAFSLVTLLVGVPLIFVGCNTRPISGVNVAVDDAICVRGCHCQRSYVPVCDGDRGVEYTSPCDAGCTDAVFVNVTMDGKKKIVRYVGCSCLSRNASSASSVVTSGRCPSLCGGVFWSAMAVNCALLFICSLVQSPLYTVLLRSVPLLDKSFAIGLQFLIMRTLGWMPAPVYFGATIDSTCLLWAGPVGAKGACKVYDNVAFRRRYLGLISGLQALGTLIMILLLAALLRKRTRS